MPKFTSTTKRLKLVVELRQTNEPGWNESFESLIKQQSETSIQVLVRDSVNSDIVANLEVNLQDVIFESQRGQHWFTCPPISKNGPAPKLDLLQAGNHWPSMRPQAKKLFVMLQLVV